MKKLLFISFLALISIGIEAAERSENELKTIASGLLWKTSRAKSASQVAPDNISILYDKDGIVVLGNDAGFAVLAKDDSVDPVFGYSDNVFDAANVNPSLMWLLEAASTAIANGNVKKYTVPESLPSSVPHFVTTQWSQKSPYNLLCPSYTVNGVTKQYPTGCVATAMAQAMNYYKYPEHGTTTRLYRFNPGDGTQKLVKVVLDDIIFDWDNMLDKYSSGSSDEQKNAVAELMMACGASVEMTYTESGSGTFGNLACNAMRNYFAYDRGIPYHHLWFETTKEFYDGIYEGIAALKPVLFGAASQSGGHAFVLDGYDEEGYVHVNWGWGPTGGDGYFEVTYLNGYNDRPNYFVVSNDGTFSNHTSRFGILEGGVDISKVDDTRIKVTTQGKIFMNVDAETFKGALYVVGKNLETGACYSLATQKTAETYVTSFTTNTKNTVLKSSVSISNKLDDGSYRIFLASKSDEETDYYPVRTADGFSNSALMTVKDGVIADLTVEDDPSWLITTSVNRAIMDKGSKTDERKYNVAGQRVADDYRGLTIMKGKKHPTCTVEHSSLMRSF
ncbi:MAG: C10 family peptidase [Prevotella sp.]